MILPEEFSIEDNRVCFYVDNIGILGLIRNDIVGGYIINGFVFNIYENQAFIVEGICIRSTIPKREIDAVVFTDTQYKNMYNAIKELINDTDHIVKNLDGGYAGHYSKINLFPSNVLGKVTIDVRIDGHFGHEKPINQPRVHEFDRIVFDIVMNKYDITPHPKWMTLEEYKQQEMQMINLFPTSL